MNRAEMATFFRSPVSYLYMTVLWRFTFPFFVFSILVACNTARTIPMEALGDTRRRHHPVCLSDFRLECRSLLSRPAGPGPFPLMILLHGHTFGSIGGGESVVPEAEAFARDLCFAGLAVSLPGYGATEVQPGADPEINVTLNVVLDGVSLVKKLPWIDSKRLYLFGFSRGAFFASLLANRIEEIKGVVLQSGAYDLNRFYWDAVWFRPMLNPDRRRGPKAPSILPDVSTWRAPTLLIHGGSRFSGFRPTGNLLRDPQRPPTYPTTSSFILITVM